MLLEAICNLMSKLLKCKDWDPGTLHSSVQKEIPGWEYLEDDVPFAIGRELIMDIPVDHHGYTEVYIDNTKD
jgi:hypothetical protein